MKVLGQQKVGFLLLLVSCLIGASPITKAEAKRETLADYIRANREQWILDDLNLVLPHPTPEAPGFWKLVRRKHKGEIDLSVYSRKDPGGNGNHLFYYWNDSRVHLPIETVEKVLTSMIPLSRNWTKELQDTVQVNYGGSDPVWYQLFVPKVVFARARRLVAVYASHILSQDEEGPIEILISCRSIPETVYREANSNSDPRIDWHGAYLLSRDRKDSNSTLIRKIDREDQKGLTVPAIVNKMMPGFLNEEVQGAVEYMNKNQARLIELADSIVHK